MKKMIFLSALAVFVISGAKMAARAKEMTLSSPDGRVVTEIVVDGNIEYSVSYKGKQMLAPSEISMTLTDGRVFGGERMLGSRSGSIRNKGIPAPIYKKAYVDDVCNYLIIRFPEYNVEFRAYDEGVAYRFVSTARKGDFNVKSEKAEFNFPDDWKAWMTFVNTDKIERFDTQFRASFENYYAHDNLSKLDSRRLAFLPALVDAPEGVKILITESDLRHYPGMFLHADGASLKNVNATLPKELVPFRGYHNIQEDIVSREDFIAKASAGQKFPWRVIGIAENDKDLVNLDLVWNLATPADESKDWSWVKPGKSTWEWWHDWTLDGVDFKAGINTETYKYYVDFAAREGLQYVLLDEGWSEIGTADLYKVVPELDLEELVRYAKSRNIGLILWAGFRALDVDVEGIMKHYADMGIAGFKVDFMNRDDQLMVDYYEKIARTAAKYHLILDLHGAYKPTGLERTYPNLLNFEGVAANEYLKSQQNADHVTHETIFPFIRMAAGPLDYSQGAMNNATKANFRAIGSDPMSQGTRCRQLAEYAIFESPLCVLCDSPANYEREKDCIKFIDEFPTVWDETVPVCGKVGEYLAVARRKGSTWYVGAITNWESRDLTLDLSFIDGGSMTIFQDGINADRAARDYKKVTANFPQGGQIKIHMAPGGGWAAIIR